MKFLDYFTGSSGSGLTDREKKLLKNGYRQFLKTSGNNFDKDELTVVRRALETSIHYLEKERIPSGKPYVLYLLDIAISVVGQIGLGYKSVAAVFIYDLVVREIVSPEFVREKFGDDVLDIVEALKKTADLSPQNKTKQSEQYQKLLISISEDVRVILIKLAFILQFMREMNEVDKDLQVQASLEAFAIYAPLAHRMGLYNVKSELENLAFKYTENKAYKEIIKGLKNTTVKREKYIKKFCTPLQESLKKQGIDFEMKGRPKSVYSIWQKMKKQNIPFEEVYDIFAIRIIINSRPETEKSDCWRVYSIVTDFYQPNPKRLRDWISIPKSNGYESLHTTVVGPDKKWVEVQIRTRRMDEIAEKGYAAHWKYKGVSSEKGVDELTSRIREILESTDPGASDALDNFKLNLYSKEVFAFTPNGDLKKLPKGATVLDFAYDIHTDIGRQCVGAKINHRNATIKQVIENGDHVEIFTSKNQKPKNDWLGFVITSKAKSKIKQSLREEKLKESEDGKELFKRRLKNWKMEFSDELMQKLLKHYNLEKPVDFYYHIATEKIDISEVKDVIQSLLTDTKPQLTEQNAEPGDEKNFSKVLPEESDFLLIDQKLDGVDFKLAKCCNPIYGDDIFGFVTVHEGIKIHRTNCPNARQMLGRFDYRVVKAKWKKTAKLRTFQATVRVAGIDDIGLVNRLTNVISKDMKVHMRSISIDSNDGMFEGNIKLNIDSLKHLDYLIKKLKKENGVLRASRVNAENN